MLLFSSFQLFNHLRNDTETLNSLSKQEKHPITSEMGEQLARNIDVVKYLECSCNDQKRIENLFAEAVWSSLRKIEQERQNHNKSFIQTATKNKPSFFKRIFKR